MGNASFDGSPGSIFRDLVAVHPFRRLVPAFGEMKAAQPEDEPAGVDRVRSTAALSRNRPISHVVPECCHVTALLELGVS